MTYGIYKLEFPNKEIYVGKSEDIETRYSQHISELKNNRHPNNKVQNAFNVQGIPKLVILEILNSDGTYLSTREIYWIDKLDSFNNGLNLDQGFIVKEETKSEKLVNDRVREAFKMLMRTKLGKADHFITDICLATGLTPKMLKSIIQGNAFTWLINEFPISYKRMLKDKYTKNWYQVTQARNNW